MTAGRRSLTGPGGAGVKSSGARTAPKGGKADPAILAATVDLLLEAGYRGVTIEGVASA